MLQSKSFLSFLVLTFAFSANLAQGQDQRELGVVEVDVMRDTTSVVVRSSDSESLSLARTAFNVHGAYRVVGGMADAAFAISIDPVGVSGARLSIFSGLPEQLQFTQTLAGTSRRNAIFRAVDLAIRKTSGNRGFFAGKLAFVSEVTGSQELFTSDVLFGEVLKLTNDGVEILRPRWSPDGDQIVFTSYRKGYPDIFRLDRRTNSLDLLVSLKGSNLSARYSPDGSKIAMILTGGGNAEVYVGDSNASRRRKLTHTSGDESAPTWSPDGSRICVASGQNGKLQLYTTSSTSFPASLRRVPTNVSGYCAEPDWNPVDENLILFTTAEGNGFQIAIYDFSKGESVKVTSERSMAVEPQWLADGRHIIYTLKSNDSKRIVLLDTVTRKRSVVSPSSLGDVSQASYLKP
ncbi:hypothetical protein MLD52_00320 [Puniceicoccaceae bacterium K14]|nr:hypothetical protein [Puniceicoccaceae bacterium K14]